MNNKLHLFFIMILLLFSMSGCTLKTSPTVDKYAESVPVLAYSGVVSDEEKQKKFKDNIYLLSETQFREQLDYLYNENFSVINAEQLKLWLKGQIQLPYKSILITIDDGYHSIKDVTYKNLLDYGYTATVFRTGLNVIDSSNNVYLDENWWQESQDLFEYGSRGFSLHFTDEVITSYGQKQYAYRINILNDQQLEKDLLQMNKFINYKYFSYPFGAYNNKIVELLGKHNYELAFTYHGKSHVRQTDNMLLLDRIPIKSSMTIEEFSEKVKAK